MENSEQIHAWHQEQERIQHEASIRFDQRVDAILERIRVSANPREELKAELFQYAREYKAGLHTRY